MLYFIYRALADDDFRAAFQYRRHQFRDIGATVLVVSVRIDDDIRTEPETRVQACCESVGKPHIVLVADDMVHAERPGSRYRPVGAPVVDDQVFDLVYALDRFWQVGNRSRQCILFVEAGYLDYQFHAMYILLTIAVWYSVYIITPRTFAPRISKNFRCA